MSEEDEETKNERPPPSSPSSSAVHSAHAAADRPLCSLTSSKEDKKIQDLPNDGNCDFDFGDIKLDSDLNTCHVPSPPPLPIVSSQSQPMAITSNAHKVPASQNRHHQSHHSRRWDSSLPVGIMEHIFQFLGSLSDLKSCALVCRRWSRLLENGNALMWRKLADQKLGKHVSPQSDLLSSLTSHRSKLRAWSHGWNPKDCSRNVFIKPHGFTLHRNPVAQSTDAARGRIGFSSGRHAWEIWWEGPLGTVAVLGVATKEAPLQAPGYAPLLGQDNESYGWNLVDNHLLHNGECYGPYPTMGFGFDHNSQPLAGDGGQRLTNENANTPLKYTTGERLRVILDCDESLLYFERNTEFLGVAFRGLTNKPLFPAVATVYGNTEVSMVYLGQPLDG